MPGGGHQLARRFFTRAGAVVDIAWGITVGNDLRLSGAATTRAPMARFLDWYLDRLQVAARHDARLALAFQRVGNLIDAPPALLRPRVAMRVLRGNLRPARRRQDGTARQGSLARPARP